MSDLSTPVERFMGSVVVTAWGCWRWEGYITPKGYGRFCADDRLVMAHRWAYEHFLGPIPEGLVIDHLCRVRHCVNPAHLEPVTNRENILRGVGEAARNAVKTHCKNGHEFTPENTNTDTRGYRICRTCEVAYQRRYWLEVKKPRVLAGLPLEREGDGE